MQPPHGRGVVGDLFDGFFQRHRLLFAHPIAEQMGLQRGIHDLRHVGTGIRKGNDRTRMLHHIQHLSLILIRNRLPEEHFQITF